MPRQYLVSPDGDAVAVRTDQTDPEAWNAWGVIHARHGGHWSASAELIGWTVAETTDETIEAPAPPAPPTPPPGSGS
jgi:hypothetical protein